MFDDILVKQQRTVLENISLFKFCVLFLNTDFNLNDLRST